MRTRALPLFILLLAACVSRGPSEEPLPEPAVQAPAAFDPAGTYEFNAEMMGQTQTGEMVLTRTSGALGGQITVRGESLPLRDVKLVEPRKITAVGAPPQADMQIQFTFTFEDNDKFTGTLTVPQMGEARVWGTRKKS